MKNSGFLFLLLIFVSCSFLGKPPTDIEILMPADKAVWQDKDIQLIWYCENSDTFYVYFGESEESMDLVSKQNSSSYALLDLSQNTLYFWKIKAVNNVGIKETPILSFTTGMNPEPVSSLVYPQCGSSANEPDVVLSWEEAENAETYSVQVAYDSLFENIVLNTETSETMCMHSNFPVDVTLFWRVQSKNSFGPSEWSSVWWFGVIDFIP